MPDTTYGPKIRHESGGDKIGVASGGIIDFETGAALKIGGVDVTAALATPVAGAAAGYKTARGQATTASASDTIVTGLATVVSAVASLEDAPVIGCDRAQAAIGDQAGTPAAGSILIKTFKPTATGDATPVAATTFTKKVNWIAIGT
jgi:hypothetical protein